MSVVDHFGAARLLGRGGGGRQRIVALRIRVVGLWRARVEIGRVGRAGKVVVLRPIAGCTVCRVGRVVRIARRERVHELIRRHHEVVCIHFLNFRYQRESFAKLILRSFCFFRELKLIHQRNRVTLIFIASFPSLVARAHEKKRTSPDLDCNLRLYLITISTLSRE